MEIQDGSQVELDDVARIRDKRSRWGSSKLRGEGENEEGTAGVEESQGCPRLASEPA